jgi:hypothetical protein
LHIDRGYLASDMVRDRPPAVRRTAGEAALLRGALAT